MSELKSSICQDALATPVDYIYHYTAFRPFRMKKRFIEDPKGIFKHPILSGGLSEIGLLDLERIRIRPIGYTLERAPFYELSLLPGEALTLRIKSFTKLQESLESTTEVTNETKTEETLTNTADFTSRLTNTINKTTQWGVNAGITGGAQGEGWNVSGSLGGNYGRTISESTVDEDSTHLVNQLVKKVEADQKKVHKVVVSTLRETTFESESTTIFRNDTEQLKRVFFRKMMQVNIVNTERYGVRMCWAPVIENPIQKILKVKEDVIRSRYLQSEYPDGSVKYISKGAYDNQSTTDSECRRTFECNIPVGYEFDFNNSRIEFTMNTPSEMVSHVRKYSYSIDVVVILQVHEDLIPCEINGDSQWAQYYVVFAFKIKQETLKKWIDKMIEEEMVIVRQQYKEKIDDRLELMRYVIEKKLDLEFPCKPGEFDEYLDLFEWENLFAKYYPDWVKTNNTNEDQQSEPTEIPTFMNAKWVKVFIPIRNSINREEDALTLLKECGPFRNIDVSTINSFRQAYDIEKQKYVTDPPLKVATPDLIGFANDILLAKLGTDSWNYDFEKIHKFITLDTFVITTPTNGIDYQELPPLHDEDCV